MPTKNLGEREPNQPLQNKRKMNKIKGLLIYAIVTILIVIFTPLGFIYTSLKNILTFKLITWLSHIQNYFLVLIVALDQYANVMMSELFNDIMLKGKGHLFGYPDDTIGHVVRKNGKKDNLTLFGKFMLLIIDHKK